MTNAIDAAMAAAQQSANQAPPAASAPTPAPQASTAVAPSVGRRMPGFSMSDAQVGMECDTWLALNKDGFGITGKAEGYNTPFFSAHCTLHPQDVMFTMVCRVDERTYWKTNDGNTLLFPKAEDPKSWHEAETLLHRMKGQSPYPSADLRMVMKKAYDAKDKEVDWPEGTRMMLGLAKTHWYEFTKFVKQCIDAGFWVETGDGAVDGEPVDMVLGYKKMDKKRVWYVPTFDLATQ